MDCFPQDKLCEHATERTNHVSGATRIACCRKLFTIDRLNMCLRKHGWNVDLTKDSWKKEKEKKIG